MIQVFWFGAERISNCLSKYGNAVEVLNGSLVLESGMCIVVSCLIALESWEKNTRVH